MTKKSKIDHYTDKEALDFHTQGKSGKIEINSSKPLVTKRDLSLAYSPGVAVPVKKIAENPETAYDYTSKGNLVAVIRTNLFLLLKVLMILSILYYILNFNDKKI